MFVSLFASPAKFHLVPSEPPHTQPDPLPYTDLILQPGFLSSAIVNEDDKRTLILQQKTWRGLQLQQTPKTKTFTTAFDILREELRRSDSVSAADAAPRSACSS